MRFVGLTRLEVSLWALLIKELLVHTKWGLKPDLASEWVNLWRNARPDPRAATRAADPRADPRADRLRQ